MPVTILTSNQQYMLNWQRTQMTKTFYAKGYFWLFYTDADDKTYFRTSKDGFNWSSATSVRAARAQNLSVTVDSSGEYVHYAWGQGAYLYYRRGKLNADGTVTWDPERQATDFDVIYPNIILDSEGYPWIGYRRASDLKPYVTKSSTKDGTWTTADGFPYKLSDISGGHPYAVPLALSGSKVYVYYWDHGIPTPVHGQLWSGTWGAEETASTSNVYTYGALARVDRDDNVYCVFRRYVPPYYSLIYVYRDAATSEWSSETVIAANLSSEPLFSFCIDLDTKYLYIFRLGVGADTIYLIRYNGETWNTVEAITGEDALNEITSFTQKYSRKNLVVWTSGAAAPYKLRCEVYNILPSILKSNIHTL